MKIIIAILILGIVVFIHELGHFLLAKKNGVTVLEFSLGMGPRLASFVHKGTRYSLKLLPFGGSCMMAGENEISDDEGAFHKKGPWARFSVLLAGAFFNFILAFVLALICIGTSGVDKPYLSSIAKDSSSDGILQPGDVITKINGSRIEFGRDIYFYFYYNPLTSESLNVTYLRDGKKNTVSIIPAWKDVYQLGFSYSGEGDSASIIETAEGFPISEAGLLPGDVIVDFNGTKITTGKSLADYMNENPMDGNSVTITYIRNGNETDRRTATLMPKLVDGYYDTGISYNLANEKVSSLSVIKYSFGELRFNIVNTVKGVVGLITGKINLKQLSGPVGIVNYVGDIVNATKGSGAKDTIIALIQFCLMISANLGVMNLLPLPALDGGRLVFVVIEIIRGKPVPTKQEAIVHVVGALLLIILMGFVTFNDIRNLF